MNEKDEEIKKKNEIIGSKNMQLEQKDKKIEELTKQLLSFLPDPHMCTVKEFPDRVFVNKEASMIVTLKNNYGKLIGINEDSLNIVIRNQNTLQEKKISYNIRETQKGCYVSFTIKKMGNYSFSVLVRGTDIHDFPRR